MDMWSNDWQSSLIEIVDTNDGNTIDFEKTFLAPDGKIYIGNSCGTQGLTIINNPEAEGTACNITYDNKFGILPLQYCGGAIPNMPNYKLGALSGSPCDTLTTVKEYVIKENEFKVYPNPTNGNATISYMLENNMPAQLIITDIVGKQIKTVELIATKQIETIDCKNLSNGIYMIQVVQNKKLLCSERLVINK
jgi:hypothetical protein